MKYVFFYDETEHSRKINYETVTANNYYDNFITGIVGWKAEDDECISDRWIGKIYVLAVTYIVFANTDSYTDEIDKRIPFRNNILHNGIVMYSDEDIDVAYELLVDLIEILICVKEQLHE